MGQRIRSRLDEDLAQMASSFKRFGAYATVEDAKTSRLIVVETPRKWRTKRPLRILLLKQDRREILLLMDDWRIRAGSHNHYFYSQPACRTIKQGYHPSRLAATSIHDGSA